MIQYGEKRCNGCRYAQETENWRGKAEIRCRNPGNGVHYGWIVGWVTEENRDWIPIYRPIWCRRR